MTTFTLVSCVALKMGYPLPARELYVSAWFRLARTLAESRGRWYVLSAKYGLVLPDQVIEPYDLRLKNKSAEWARRVVMQLQPHEPGDSVLLLAGHAYAGSLTSLLTKAGYTVDLPLKGLAIGQQLAWLKAQIQGDKG